jgi:hypothetical protein
MSLPVRTPAGWPVGRAPVVLAGALPGLPQRSASTAAPILAMLTLIASASYTTVDHAALERPNSSGPRELIETPDLEPSARPELR